MASNEELKRNRALAKVKALSNNGQMLLSSHDWAKLSKEEQEAAAEVIDVGKMQSLWPRHVVLQCRWKDK